MPLTGTPRLFVVVIHFGASPREPITNSSRDDVYSPELSTDRTAARITRLSTFAEPDTPMRSSAATNGDSPGTTSFHGTTTTIRNVEMTKNARMRNTTELTALRIAFAGSLDSAAAMVTTSTPVIEKMTTTTPTNSVVSPLGSRPPCSVRLEKSADAPGHRPKTNRPHIAMNAMMATTL